MKYVKGCTGSTGPVLICWSPCPRRCGDPSCEVHGAHPGTDGTYEAQPPAAAES